MTISKAAASAIVERAERRAEINKEGPYTTAIVVEAEDLELAQELAPKYLELCETADAAKGRKGRTAKREQDAIARQIVSIAQLEPRGNTALWDIEIESGLLEPYDPSVESDRKQLARHMSEKLLEGSVEVR